MIVQCLDCKKKYLLKAQEIPVEGAAVRCKGCDQVIRLARRDNAETDRSGITAFKKDNPREQKWNREMTETIRSFGYSRNTAEFNLLFNLVRKLRKMHGIAFVPIRLRLETERVERDLDYNVLHLVSDHCLPVADESGDSPLRKLVVGLWDAIKTHDYHSRFTLAEVMRVAWPDAFPALFVFAGLAPCGEKGEPGRVSEVTFTLDGLRNLPPDLELDSLPQVARVEISAAPLSASPLPFAERSAPGLVAHPAPACASDAAAALLRQWS
ncbi:MAG: zinc-ribbon domain-containing protein [Thermodesulfobacteriota bacterium]